MPGKTFAPLTQSMPLPSEDESHGLRRESHPSWVAFLLPANIRLVIPCRKHSPQDFDSSVPMLFGCGTSRTPSGLNLNKSGKKKPPELRSQRPFDSIKPVRLPRNQERCTCTCFQLPSSFCQIRVSQQRAVTGSPFTSFFVGRFFSTTSPLMSVGD